MIRRYPQNIASKLVYFRSIRSPDLHGVQVAKEVAMGYSCFPVALPKYSCDVVCFMTKYGLLCPNKIRMTRKYSTHQRRLVQSASAIYLAFISTLYLWFQLNWSSFKFDLDLDSGDLANVNLVCLQSLKIIICYLLTFIIQLCFIRTPFILDALCFMQRA